MASQQGTLAILARHLVLAVAPLKAGVTDEASFRTLLARLSTAWPHGFPPRAHGRSANAPIIGYLGPNTPVVESEQVAAFVCRLRELDGMDVPPSRPSLGRRNGASRVPLRSPRLLAKCGRDIRP